MNTRPGLAPDAAMVLGIATTALPFARTPEDEAERWLRVLRLHGEVGAALQSLGVSEDPLPAPHEDAAEGRPAGPGADAASEVAQRAVRIAMSRDAPGVSTTDVLLAVIDVYDETFDRVLQAHGTDRREVLERLDVEAFSEQPD